jgi:hypothetical protein
MPMEGPPREREVQNWKEAEPENHRIPCRLLSNKINRAIASDVSPYQDSPPIGSKRQTMQPFEKKMSNGN